MLAFKQINSTICFNENKNHNKMCNCILCDELITQFMCARAAILDRWIWLGICMASTIDAHAHYTENIFAHTQAVALSHMYLSRLRWNMCFKKKKREKKNRRKENKSTRQKSTSMNEQTKQKRSIYSQNSRKEPKKKIAPNYV